ncbi:hypothetical protein Nmel_000435 [Mimus melanotis]
MSDTTSAARVY